MSKYENVTARRERRAAARKERSIQNVEGAGGISRSTAEALVRNPEAVRLWNAMVRSANGRALLRALGEAPPDVVRLVAKATEKARR